ncbi:Isochorismatase-like protein [Trichoderma sp. SZMC 28011]
MTSTSGTAVLLIDPYNDFIHPEGKWYGNVKESLEATETVKHMRRLIQAARAAHIPIYYCLHQQYKPGNYDGWNRMTSYHIGMKEGRVIEEGSWGAQIYEGMEPDLTNGDVVVSKHWNASSFQNTDLDYLLHQRDITKLVCAGMTSNQCLECTARYGKELGYDVTLLSNATAGFTIEQKDAAVNLIWPLLVERVMTVEEWADSIGAPKQ